MFIFSVFLFVPVGSLADWAPKDSAPYEIVSSRDEFTVSKNGASSVVSEVTYRVLNEQGRSHLVLYGIPFVPDVNKVTVLKASSVTDGVETAVDLKTIKIQAAEGPSGGLSDSKKMVIPFTNIKVGSLVKYKYRDQQNKSLVPGHFSMQFLYGAMVPESDSYTVIKSDMPLQVAASDPWQSLKITPRQEGKLFILEIQQVKSLYKVPLELNPLIRRHQITMVEVSSSSDWKAYIGPVADRYEKILKVKDFPKAFQKIVDKAAKQEAVTDKIDIVTSELASIMTYSGDWSTFEKMFFPKSLAAIGGSKTGDCKDFSLATVAMLRKLGIDAEVAMTHRKSRGQLGVVVLDTISPEMPRQTLFNHAIVKVRTPNKVLWVDPTNIVSNSAYIFDDIAGSPAIEISRRATELEKIPYPQSSQSSIEFVKTYNIKEDLTAETNTKFEFTGSYAKYIAELAFSKSHKDATKLMMAFNRTNPETAKPFYEGVDLKSRLTHRYKGIEKAIGEKVMSEEKGKYSFFAPLPMILQGVFALANGNRATDLNIQSLSQEKVVLQVNGYDFVDHPHGCTIHSPWFTLQRTFVKTKTGFEVRDFVSFRMVEIPAEDLNTDKFKLSVGDVMECAGTQSVEVKKLQDGDTWEKRIGEYNSAKVAKLMKASGPGTVDASRTALHIIDNILSWDPKNKEMLITKVRSLRRVGYKSNLIDASEYYAEGKAILAVLSADYPSDPQVLWQKTWSSWFDKNNSEMISNFQKYHGVAPKNYDFYNLGGNVAERLEKSDAALGAYIKALEFAQDPNEKSEAMVNIATILLDKGEVEKGLSYYKMGALANPKNTWIQGNLMDILRRKERWDDAIEVGEAVMKDGGYGVARASLAKSYLGKADYLYRKNMHMNLKSEDGQKHLEEVEGLLMKALKNDSDCGQCLVAMGAVYRLRAVMSKDREMAFKAKAYYEKATKEGKIPPPVVSMSLHEIEQVISEPRMPAAGSGDLKAVGFTRSSRDLWR